MKLVPGPQKLSVGGDEEPPSSDKSWHWSVIGAVAIFLAWLPLSWLATSAARALSSSVLGIDEQVAALRWETSSLPSKVAIVAIVLAPRVLAFLVAAAAGGAVVGRYGGSAGVKEAAVAGFGSAFTAWMIAVVMAGQMPSIGSLLSLVLVCAGGTLAAALGGRLGLSRKARRSVL
jgi:hypothetical protein